MYRIQFRRHKIAILFKVEKLVSENDFLNISKRNLMDLTERAHQHGPG